MVHESHLFMAGGDVPIDAFKRLTWKTSQDRSSKNIAQNQADCQLEHNCLVVAPGDLHTVVLTGAHHPHN